LGATSGEKRTRIVGLADIFYEALLSRAVGGFNVGSGSGINVNELLRLPASQLCAVPAVIRDPARQMGVLALVIDYAKARNTCDWSPRVTLGEGIAEVAGWVRSQVDEFVADSSIVALAS
jgi:nucleoside-diphosphate-sugar epimerase